MIRYCPYCDERMTHSVIEGTPYFYCAECEYFTFPLTRSTDSATMPRAASGRESSRSRATSAVLGG